MTAKKILEKIMGTPIHGGKRPGAGRKPLNPRTGATEAVIQVRVSEAQKQKFLQLGGSYWVRVMIDHGIVGTEVEEEEDFDAKRQSPKE